MVQHRVWWGAGKHLQVNKARRYVNREPNLYIAKEWVNYYFGIVYQVIKLFREDGVQLSDWGANIFLDDIKEGISKCLGIRWVCWAKSQANCLCLLVVDVQCRYSVWNGYTDLVKDLKDSSFKRMEKGFWGSYIPILLYSLP